MKWPNFWVGMVFVLSLNCLAFGSALQVDTDDISADKPITERRQQESSRQLSADGSKNHASLSRIALAIQSRFTADYFRNVSLPDNAAQFNETVPQRQPTRRSRDAPVTILGSYTEHNPIFIEHNDNFTDLGFSGGGISGDPYLITGLNITNTTGPLIVIQDTTAHFNISGNLLNGLNQADWGISLSNVIHGTIEHNFVANLTQDGISLNSSPNNTIANNTVYNNDNQGIALGGSNNNTITNNTVFNTDMNGIALGGSENNVIFNNTIYNIVGWAGISLSAHNNTVANNTVHNCEHGIALGFGPAHHNTIANNTVYNCQNGIGLWDSNNNTIFSNSVHDNNGWGINIGDFSDTNTIVDNTVHGNSGGGINLGNSHHSTIANNTAYNCADGIWLGDSNNNTISDNKIFNVTSFGGIHFSYSDNNTVNNNTIFNCDMNGIHLGQDCNKNLFSNNTIYNCQFGIVIHNSSNNAIASNTIHDNLGGGIDMLDSSNNNILANNTIHDNNEAGIGLGDSGNNTIANNTVYQCKYGIAFGGPDRSDNNTVANNTVSNNAIDGILLRNGDKYTVVGNTVHGNSGNGISLENSHHSTIANNTIFNADMNGIVLGDSENNVIFNNTIFNVVVPGSSSIFLFGSDYNHIANNTVYSCYRGIDLGWSNYNTIVNNTFHDNRVGIFIEGSLSNIIIASNVLTSNSAYGIWLGTAVSSCLLWNNVLSANAAGNAWDANGTNQWDNDTHGNWWADYFGPDWNHDGIGETPYLISGGAGAQDRYPLVDVTDSSPPTVDAPANVSFAAGTTGYVITWQPADAHPCWFNITCNGALKADNAWNGSAISIPLDDAVVGVHNYTLTVYDQQGNWASDTVFVTVDDTAAPSIDQPANIAYKEGTTGHAITWQPSDASPATYTIYRNGTIIEADNWNGSAISITIDGLTPGTYNYTLIVVDEGDRSASDTVIVTVLKALTATTGTSEASKTAGVAGFTLGILLIAGIAFMLARRQPCQKPRD